MSEQTDVSTRRAAESALSGLEPRITYVSYHVADIERALGFYVGVLGMKEQMRLDLGNGVHEVVLGFGGGKGAGVILMWKVGATTTYQHGDAYSRFIVNVTDVDAAVRELEARGVPVPVPPTTAGALRYAMIKDPDGYVIELLQPPRR